MFILCKYLPSKVEKQAVLDDLMREVMSLWQTDELRRSKPTPLDGKRWVK